MPAKEKIIAVHLLNDFSGSPLVFTQALEALQQEGHDVVLHTTAGRDGFLSRLNADVKHVPYTFYENPLLRLFAFLINQCFLFNQVLKYRKEDIIIYINTLLPFGAALAGKLTGKKVVYHIHESYIRPLLLKNFLRKVAEQCAMRVIYVSEYLQREEKLNTEGDVIYNVVPDTFKQRAAGFIYNFHRSKFSVLMVCSLKKYKGIPEYIALAQRNPDILFELVLNATEREIITFFLHTPLPSNLVWFSSQADLDPFYRRTDLVVNLTNPALCIETFGMTILEAMVYGIPVIAPPVGGPAELIENDYNGYAIDVRNTQELDKCIRKLSHDSELCSRLSKGARSSAQRFSSENFRSQILHAFSPVAVEEILQ